MNQTPEMDEKKTSSPETAPIAATAEHNANFEENIRAIIRSGKPASVIRDDLDNYHANDIAEVLETLDTATRKRLYNILSLEMTAEIFTYLDEPAPYLHELGLDRAAAVLAEMDADEAVDILENLDSEEKEALIARMDQESKDDIHLIFSYDEEQIGSRMTTNYIVIPNNCTIKQAMRHLISQAEDNDNNAPAYIPFSTAQTLYNAGYGLDEIIFTVKGISTQEEFDAFEKRFRQQMGARHKFDPEDRRAIGMWSTLENFMMLNGMMNGIALFIWVIGIGTLTAGIVGVSNIMLITVRERTREFGIRKAIGATPFSILKLIIVESILITAVFGYLGMILGIGLTEGINSVMEMMNAGKNVSQDDMSIFLNPTVNLSVALSATALIIGAGVLAGYFPARKAVKITAIEAMRNE